MSNIIKTLTAAQVKLAAIQKQMAEAEFEGSAGGGLVKVTVTGAHVPKAVAVAPSVLKEDVDTVESLVLAALTAAHQNVERVLKEKTGNLTKALNPFNLKITG